MRSGGNELWPHITNIEEAPLTAFCRLQSIFIDRIEVGAIDAFCVGFILYLDPGIKTMTDVQEKINVLQEGGVSRERGIGSAAAIKRGNGTLQFSCSVTMNQLARVQRCENPVVKNILGTKAKNLLFENIEFPRAAQESRSELFSRPLFFLYMFTS